jgi:two-component system sensor histidine kinase AgrC
MSLAVLELICVMLQYLMCGLYFLIILKPRKHPAALVITVFISQSCLYELAQILQLPNLVKFSLLSLGLFLVLFLLAENSWQHKLIALGTQMIFSLLSEFIGLLVYGYLTNFNYDALMTSSAARIVTITIYLNNFMGMGILFAIFWNKTIDMIRFRLALLLLFLPASENLLLVGLYKNNYTNFSRDILWIGLIFAMVIIAANLLVYWTILHISQLYRERHEFEQMNYQNEYQYRYFKMAAEQIEDTHRLKHDIANQLQTAYALLDNRASALSIVDHLSKDLQGLGNLTYTAQPIVNTVLALKVAEAEQLGIVTTIKVDLDSEQPFADHHLCSIFANLFDNAIEAVRSLPPELRHVTISAGERAGCLVIQFSNPFVGKVTHDESGAILTTKPDSLVHGFGLKSVKAIAQKYGGDLQVRHDAGRFEVTVILREHS